MKEPYIQSNLSIPSKTRSCIIFLPNLYSVVSYTTGITVIILVTDYVSFFFFHDCFITFAADS